MKNPDILAIGVDRRDIGAAQGHKLRWPMRDSI